MKSNRHETIMQIDSWKTLNYLTFILCSFTTIGLSVYSILRYCANEDVTLVQIVNFHSTEERLYPSLTICIEPPYLEDRFELLKNDGINASSYIQFLKGEIWDDRMFNIDYDNVTVSFADNLILSNYITRKGETKNWNLVYYVSYRSSYAKCFTIDAPYVDKELLWYFRIDISNDIFPNGGRSASNRIFTYLHYPGQRFMALSTLKYNWDSRENKTRSYWMRFNIKNVNVISRRNKPYDSCLKDWKNFDRNVLNDAMI